VDIVESRLARLGEEIYEENKADLEKSYLGKIIAIEVESREVAGVGESVEEAYATAVKRHPKSPFYFRRVGEDRAAGYVLSVD